MKIKLLSLALLVGLVHCTSTKAQTVSLNGGFENVDPKTKLPTGWPAGPTSDYSFKLDSVVKHGGKYAMQIASVTDKAKSAYFGAWLPYKFTGKKIRLTAFIKTEGVDEGNASVYINVPGSKNVNSVAYANMDDQKIKGTLDWKEYTLTLDFDPDKATGISAGAYLMGKGKMWIDDVKIFVDDVPVENAAFKTVPTPKALKDTAFSKSSGVVLTSVSKQQVQNLALLGQVWGFLKYHHPAIAKGDYNMDAELFRVMPAVIKAQNSKEASAAIEQWADKFGVPEKCAQCKPYGGNNIAIKPDYGMIFNKAIVSPSLIAKLTYILDNRNLGDSHYMSMTQVGNPDVTHEFTYAYMPFPDAGYRLLSLYRYWNIIQYFFPYRDIIGKDWNTVLTGSIEKFATAPTALDYQLATVALIGEIHDTHANLWSQHKELETYRGMNTVPFGAQFVENKLTVTSYYNDTLGVKDKLKIGDVIRSINGTSVSELIKKYLPITAASNYETQLRDMPRVYLLRTDKPQFDMVIERDGRTITQSIATLPLAKVKMVSPFNPDPKLPGYKLLDDNIGYVFPARYFNKDLPDIKKLFKDTKGIIIDMRCYPSEFMPFTFVPYVKTGSKPEFVKFTMGNANEPGLFRMNKPLTNPVTNEYKGKVVVIVNEYSQSQAEYTTMAFQSSANVKVIGSMTAAADGNVSPIPLPGGMRTMISGLGVFYPDGTPTQRVGVKLDEVVKPSIAGVKAGKDELLDRAKAIIMQ